MKMKKTLFGAFLGMFAIAGIAVLPNSVLAGDAGDDEDPATQGDSSEGRTNQINGAPSQGSMINQYAGYNPNVPGKSNLQNDNLIVTIKKAINWVLGILSFIALCLCLWGGFQMMTSGGDSKKYEAGVNLLKRAAIGLAVIAVSWLVVSLVFYLLKGSITTTTGSDGTDLS